MAEHAFSVLCDHVRLIMASQNHDQDPIVTVLFNKA